MSELWVPGFRLGKLAPREDPRTLSIDKYIDRAALVAALEQLQVADLDLTAALLLKMFLNDQLGCCAIAGPGHMIGAWTKAASGIEAVLDDADILTGYEAVGGYVPGDASTDNGCVLLDVLTYWRNTGIGGHKIGAFVKVNWLDHDLLRIVNAVFGGTLWGHALPQYVAPNGPGDVPAWTAPVGPLSGTQAVGGLGGHCTDKLKYVKLPSGLVAAQNGSWGQLIDVDPGFDDAYADECWAIISDDWLTPGGKTIDGFDAQQLAQDLAEATA